jgi:thiamine biosynthesis lipoprotein ApbE
MRIPFPITPLFALVLAMLPGINVRGIAAEPFRFHHENILGTSLDLQVCAADEKQAGAVEAAVLDEIERLRKVLSTYDPASELSRLNAATAPMACSQELVDVLTAYDWWTSKTRGAYNGHLGELIAAWQAAEKAGAPPDAAALAPIVRTLAMPGWKIEAPTRTITRLTAQPINVNSLGKGYILAKAVVAARAKAPAVTGLLLNIGGDIYASGHTPAGTPWEIGVADPKHSEDNAPPLTRVRLSDHAISTSAAYERGYTIAGRRYSHIFDPRTGMPADAVASATVVSSNNANANALATTLCVLKPEEGLALVRSLPGNECLIVAADGRQLRSDHFAAIEDAPKVASTTPPATPAKPATPLGAKPGAWPSGFEVSIAIDLKQPDGGGRRVKRPFVAVWVDNAEGKRVRTVAVWGRERKYLPDLHEWWKGERGEEQWAQSITRATRNAGQHRIAWDGMDDHGAPLPLGTYTITVEANREHGTYAIQSGKIECGKVPAKGTVPAGSEFGETQLSYGPPGQ